MTALVRVDFGRPGESWYARVADVGEALLAHGWREGAHTAAGGRLWFAPPGPIGPIPFRRLAHLADDVEAVDPPGDVDAERSLRATFTHRPELEPAGTWEWIAIPTAAAEEA